MVKDKDKVIAAIQNTTDFAELVGSYVKCRDDKEDKKREYAAATADLDEVMNLIETRLLALLKESNTESVRTSYGTAHKTTKSSAKIADWNVFVDYVKKNDAFDLLTKAVAKDAVKSRIDETGEIVPGVNIITFETVGVRRA